MTSQPAGEGGRVSTSTGFRIIVAAGDSSSPQCRELAGTLGAGWPAGLPRARDVRVRSYATLRADALEAGEILPTDVIVAVDPGRTPEQSRAAGEALCAAMSRGAALVRLIPSGRPPIAEPARSANAPYEPWQIEPDAVDVDPRLGVGVLAGVIAGVASRQCALAGVEREARDCARASEALAESLERLNADLTLAASVQRECMSCAPPVVGCVRSAAVYRPSGGVCGDVYELVRLDEHRIAFLVADVSGHGLAAGLMAMVVGKAACFRESGARGGDALAPEETLRRINLLFLRSRGESALLATAVCGIVDARDRTVRLASAGHPPVLRVADEGVSLVRCSGVPLGISPSSTFQGERITLREGEVLLAYTDGLEGVLSPRSREGGVDRVGDERDLARRLKRVCPHLSPDRLTDSLAELERTLSEQNGSLHQEDDLTLVAIGVARADRATPLNEARHLARRIKEEGLEALQRATASIRGS